VIAGSGSGHEQKLLPSRSNGWFGLNERTFTGGATNFPKAPIADIGRTSKKHPQHNRF
jgi:hypothetical protein